MSYDPEFDGFEMTSQVNNNNKNVNPISSSSNNNNNNNNNAVNYNNSQHHDSSFPLGERDATTTERTISPPTRRTQQLQTATLLNEQQRAAKIEVVQPSPKKKNNNNDDQNSDFDDFLDSPETKKKQQQQNSNLKPDVSLELNYQPPADFDDPFDFQSHSNNSSKNNQQPPQQPKQQYQQHQPSSASVSMLNDLIDQIPTTSSNQQQQPQQHQHLQPQQQNQKQPSMTKLHDLINQNPANTNPVEDDEYEYYDVNESNSNNKRGGGGGVSVVQIQPQPQQSQSQHQPQQQPQSQPQPQQQKVRGQEDDFGVFEESQIIPDSKSLLSSNNNQNRNSTTPPPVSTGGGSSSTISTSAAAAAAGEGTAKKQNSVAFYDQIDQRMKENEKEQQQQQEQQNLGSGGKKLDEHRPPGILVTPSNDNNNNTEKNVANSNNTNNNNNNSSVPASASASAAAAASAAAGRGGETTAVTNTNTGSGDATGAGKHAKFKAAAATATAAATAAAGGGGSSSFGSSSSPPPPKPVTTPISEMSDAVLLRMTVLSRVVERFRFKLPEDQLDMPLTVDLFRWMLCLDPEVRFDPSKKNEEEEHEDDDDHHHHHQNNNNNQDGDSSNSNNTERKRRGSGNLFLTEDLLQGKAPLAPDVDVIATQLFDQMSSVKTTFRHVLTFDNQNFPLTTRKQRDALRKLALQAVVTVQDAFWLLQDLENPPEDNSSSSPLQAFASSSSTNASPILPPPSASTNAPNLGKRSRSNSFNSGGGSFRSANSSSGGGGSGIGIGIAGTKRPFVSHDEMREADPIINSLFGPHEALPGFVFSSLVDALSEHPDKIMFTRECAKKIISIKDNMTMMIPVLIVFITALFVVPYMQVDLLHLVQRVSYLAATDDFGNYCKNGPTDPLCDMIKRGFMDIKVTQDINIIFRRHLVEQLWPDDNESARASDRDFFGNILVGAIVLKISPELNSQARRLRIERDGRDDGCTHATCDALNLSEPVSEFLMDATFSCEAFNDSAYNSVVMIPFATNRSEALRIAGSWIADWCEEEAAQGSAMYGMYNPSSKIISWASVLITVPKPGGTLNRVYVQTASVGASTPVAILAVAQVVCLLWLIDHTIRRYRPQLGWVENVLTFQNVLHLMLTVLILAAWAVLNTMPSEDEILDQVSQAEYVPKFDAIVAKYNLGFDLAGIWIAIFFVFSARLFSDMIGIGIITHLLKLSSSDVTGLLVVFFMVTLCFLTIGRCLFGTSNTLFAFTSTATVFLMRFYFGEADFEAVKEEHPFAGTVYFFLWLAFVAIYAMNLIIAVISSQLGDVEARANLHLELFERIVSDSSNFRTGEEKWFGWRTNSFAFLNVVLDSLASNSSYSRFWGDFYKLNAVLCERFTRKQQTSTTRQLLESAVGMIVFVELDCNLDVKWDTAVRRAVDRYDIMEDYRADFIFIDRVIQKQTRSNLLRDAILIRCLIALDEMTTDIEELIELQEGHHEKAAKRDEQKTSKKHQRELKRFHESFAKKLATSGILGGGGNSGNSSPGSPSLKNSMSGSFAVGNNNSRTASSDPNSSAVGGGKKSGVTIADVAAAAVQDANKKQQQQQQNKNPSSSSGKHLTANYSPTAAGGGAAGASGGGGGNVSSGKNSLGGGSTPTTAVLDASGGGNTLAQQRARNSSFSFNNLTSPTAGGAGNNNLATPLLTSLQKSSSAANYSFNSNNNDAYLDQSGAVGGGSAGLNNTNNNLQQDQQGDGNNNDGPDSHYESHARCLDFLVNSYVLRLVKGHQYFPIMCIISIGLFISFFTPILQYRESSTWMSENLKKIFTKYPFRTNCDDDQCTAGMMHTKFFAEDLDHVGEIGEYFDRLFIPMVFHDNDSTLPFIIPRKFRKEHDEKRTFPVFVDEYIRRTQPVTIRQHQSVTKPCSIPPQSSALRHSDRQRFDAMNKMTCYEHQGIETKPLARPSDSELPQSAYEFQEGCVEDHGVVGEFRTWYPCSGYQVDIHNASQAHYLANNWLNHGTQFVVITSKYKSTFSKLNPYFDGRILHVQISLYIEFGPGGGAASKAYAYTQPDGYWMERFVWPGVAYFGIDLLWFLFRYIETQFRLWRAKNGHGFAEKVRGEHKAPDAPYCTFIAAIWIIIVWLSDLRYEYRMAHTMSALVLAATGICIKTVVFPLLRTISHRSAYLDRVLTRSMGSVRLIVPYYFILSISFVYAGHCLLGRFALSYSTLRQSIESVALGLLGQFQFEEIFTHRPFVAVVFTGCFVAIVLVCLANLLIGLLTMAAEEAKTSVPCVHFIRRISDFTNHPLYCDEVVCTYLSWYLCHRTHPLKRLYHSISACFGGVNVEKEEEKKQQLLEKWKRREERRKKKMLKRQQQQNLDNADLSASPAPSPSHHHHNRHHHGSSATAAAASGDGAGSVSANNNDINKIERKRKKKQKKEQEEEEMKRKNSAGGGGGAAGSFRLDSRVSSSDDESSSSSSSDDDDGADVDSLNDETALNNNNNRGSSSGFLDQFTTTLSTAFTGVFESATELERSVQKHFLGSHVEYRRQFVITAKGRFARPAEVLLMLRPAHQLNELAAILKLRTLPEVYLLSLSLFIARTDAKFRRSYRHHSTLDEVLEASRAREIKENRFSAHFMRKADVGPSASQELDEL